MSALLTRQRLLYAAGLLVLVVATVWMRSQEESPAPLLSGVSHLSDYEMSGLELSDFDAQGVLQHQIRASHMAHYPQTGITQIRQPQLSLYEQGHERWRLKAERGQIDQAGEVAKLQGAVVLDGVAESGRAPLQLVTRDVQMDLQRRRASTDQPVYADYGHDVRVDAHGMSLDLTRQQLELKSRVHIIYENQP